MIEFEYRSCQETGFQDLPRSEGSCTEPASSHILSSRASSAQRRMEASGEGYAPLPGACMKNAFSGRAISFAPSAAAARISASAAWMPAFMSS